MFCPHLTAKPLKTEDANKLRQQIPLIVSTVLFSAIGALYTISSTILLDSFTTVEQQATRQSVQRVLDALSGEFNKLNTTAGDYAKWDDTYNFVKDGNQDYIKSNFDKATFALLQLNLVTLLKSSHQIAFSQGFDLKTGKKTPPPQNLQEYLAINPLLLQHSAPSDSKVGILPLPTGSMMIASHPIVTSQAHGPIRGTLLMGRYLNNEQIEQLAQLTRVSVAVHRYDDAQLPADFSIARSFLSNSKAIFVYPLNNNSIAGYAKIEDIYGKPALLLRVDTPRVIYQQGLLSLRYLKLSLLAVGLLFGAIAWKLLRKLVLYIIERDRLTQILCQEKDLAEVTLHSICDGVITTDAEGIIESLNPVAEQLTGWTIAQARGLPLSKVFMVVDEDTLEPVENLIELALHQSEKTSEQSCGGLLIAQCGDKFAIDVSVAPIQSRDGQTIGSVLVFRDITQARQMARQLSWQASYDSLTGLTNRREFENRLEQAVASARAKQLEHSLCFLDLDRFKLVNDSCGHAAGDELLRQVSALLQAKLRKSDVVGRLGGDEFGLLLYQCPLNRAMQIAEAICESIQEYQFVWQDKVFNIGVSMGLVAVTSDSASLTDILSAADAACYAAKNKGRGRLHVYHADDQEMQQQRGEMQWAVKIEQALVDNRLHLYYQTIVPLKANHAHGRHYEVLLRLLDEQGKVVSPAAFLPAAERYNLMPTIDRWVIRTLFASQAENYQQAWNICQAENSDYLYTINLSGASINDDKFADFVREQFEHFQVPPQMICFEITETVAIANLSKAVELMRKLKKLGCRFALDDFGSGMSSFAYLKNLPVDYLKIDGGFVKDIMEDPISLAMVEAMNRIGGAMGIQTIAEFVENDAIREKVTALGVDYAQGYGIAKPKPLL